MKKKKKRENQSRVVDTIIALVFSLLTGYAATTGFQMIDTKQNFIDLFKEYDTKFRWLMDQPLEYKMIIFVVSVGMFILIAALTMKKPSGYKDASEHGAYGNAQFSDPDDLRDMGYIAGKKESKWSEKDPLKTLGANEGIILGKVEDELLILHPDSSMSNRNVLVVGSSGSAKGQAFVINNILNNRSESIVVTDPKGELYELTSEIKRDQGYRVEQVDFLNLKGSRFNPLDYVTSDFEAVKLSTAISMNSAKDVKQDFFFNTARDLLTGLIIYAKEESSHPNISKTVKGIFNNITEDENYLPELCERIGIDHPAYQYLKDAAAQSGNTRASILSSFAQQTGVFSLGSVGKLTETSDFMFHDLQTEKTIIYVKIPVKDNPVPALTATFFDQLITTLYDIGDKHHGILPIPTILLLDEFANLGKLNDFDNMLSTCRGYGIGVMTIVQDFAQLEGKYSKEISRSIINNHDTTLFLRTKDTETARYFEELAGDTTINFKTKSQSGGGGFLYILGFGSANPSKSTSEQYIKKPLVSKSTLLSMQNETAYVFVPNHVLEIEKAYQSKLYKGFITGTKKELVNGVKRFPYTYPQWRDAYIKKFKLQPYKTASVEIPEEKPKTVIETPPVVSEAAPTQEPVKQEPIPVKTNPKEDGINLIVSSFFADLEKKEANKKAKEAEQAKQAEATQPIPPVLSSSKETIELAEIAVEDLKSTDVLVSDPVALFDLKSISVLPQRFEEMNTIKEEIHEMTDLLSELNTDGLSTDETPSKKPATDDEVDLMDEMPM